MSERKSWDVQPKRRVSARPAPAPARERLSVNGVRPVRRPAAPVRAPRTTARPQGERLRDRRRKKRKTGTIILAVFFVALLALVIYLLWLPQLRIQSVHAEGPQAEGVERVAQENLSGRYALILPRNSIFFFPKGAVRDAVLSTYPEISALSISRSSFTSVSLLGTPRASAFVWCGTTIDTPQATCFDTDAEGLVFKEAVVSTSTVVLTTASGTPTTPSDLRIFSPLDRELGEAATPVGAHVMNAEAIPDALRFVKAVRSLGVPVSSLVLRGDEADLWLNGPTRITYVLGREEEAAELAASVIPGLNLTNGSLQYLDLRFSGKAYIKRYGE
jgi:hypothetical protein